MLLFVDGLRRTGQALSVSLRQSLVSLPGNSWSDHIGALSLFVQPPNSVIFAPSPYRPLLTRVLKGPTRTSTCGYGFFTGYSNKILICLHLFKYIYRKMRTRGSNPKQTLYFKQSADSESATRRPSAYGLLPRNDSQAATQLDTQTNPQSVLLSSEDIYNYY